MHYFGVKNLVAKEGNIMSMILFLITFIVLSYVMSRYLYTVALIVPSKMDVLFSPIEKGLYKLIGTSLESTCQVKHI